MEYTHTPSALFSQNICEYSRFHALMRTHLQMYALKWWMICVYVRYMVQTKRTQLDAFIHTISVKMRIHFFDISMSSVWYTIFTIYTHIWMWHKSPRVWCNNKNNSNNIHVQLNGNKQNTRHKSHVKLQGKKIVWLLINNKYE